MKLQPRDLGTKHYLEILHCRLTPMVSPVTGQTVVVPPVKPVSPKTSRNRLLRFWLRDFNLKGELYEKTKDLVATSPSFTVVPFVGVLLSVLFFFPTLAALSSFTLPGVTFGLFIMALWFCSLWAAMVSMPRSHVKRLVSNPLLLAELEAIVPQARGRLDRAYLTLVLDVLRRDNTTLSPSAQTDLRAALAALGDTISQLPANPAPTMEPATLRREAETFRTQAGSENDAFVQASLLRQADTLQNQADTGAENSVAARRTNVLRREVRTQLNALRALLAASEPTAPNETARAVALADAVSRLANEAKATSQAHREIAEAEIAALLGYAPPAALPTEPVQTPTAAPVSAPSYTEPNAPQVQQVGVGRQWWRGG